MNNIKAKKKKWSDFPPSPLFLISLPPRRKYYELATVKIKRRGRKEGRSLLFLLQEELTHTMEDVHHLLQQNIEVCRPMYEHNQVFERWQLITRVTWVSVETHLLFQERLPPLLSLLFFSSLSVVAASIARSEGSPF